LEELFTTSQGRDRVLNEPVRPTSDVGETESRESENSCRLRSERWSPWGDLGGRQAPLTELERPGKKLRIRAVLEETAPP
jgi:hypothetical protein